MTLSTDEFLQRVYALFRQHGAWPRVRDLQVGLRQHGTVALLAARAGSTLVNCESSQDAVCFLTLRGLQRCPDAADDLAAYVRLVRHVAQRAVAGNEAPVSASEVEHLLEDDPATRRRMGEIAYRDSRIHQGWHTTAENFSLGPRWDTMFYDGIESIEDIFAVDDRLAADGREASGLHWARYHGTTAPEPEEGAEADPDALSPNLPAGLNIRRPELKAVADNDLKSLADALTTHNWRPAAVFAGSCLEALILDLWFRVEDQAKANWKDRWPNKVPLATMVAVASEKKLISAIHGDLASALRKARNLVHPLLAAVEPAPTGSFVGVLVAALIHLNEDLSATQ